MKLNFEHTDTFGGESNYSWLRKESLIVNDNISDLAIVRKAKAWAGITGFKCKVEKLGEMIAIYPKGLCHVIFITFES